LSFTRGRTKRAQERKRRPVRCDARTVMLCPWDRPHLQTQSRLPTLRAHIQAGIGSRPTTEEEVEEEDASKTNAKTKASCKLHACHAHTSVSLRTSHTPRLSPRPSLAAAVPPSSVRPVLFCSCHAFSRRFFPPRTSTLVTCRSLQLLGLERSGHKALAGDTSGRRMWLQLRDVTLASPDVVAGITSSVHPLLICLAMRTLQCILPRPASLPVSARRARLLTVREFQPGHSRVMKILRVIRLLLLAGTGRMSSLGFRL